VTDAASGRPWLGSRALSALVAASLLISQAAGGLYSALDRSQPEIVTVLGNLLLSLSVIAWFRHYSRTRSIAWVFDMGTFLLWLWILLVPYYLVTREGWRGMGRVALFVLAYVLAGLVGGFVPRLVLALTAGG